MSHTQTFYLKQGSQFLDWNMPHTQTILAPSLSQMTERKKVEYERYTITKLRNIVGWEWGKTLALTVKNSSCCSTHSSQ